MKFPAELISAYSQDEVHNYSLLHTHMVMRYEGNDFVCMEITHKILMMQTDLLLIIFIETPCVPKTSNTCLSKIHSYWDVPALHGNA